MKTGFDSAINAAEDRGERALERRLKAEKRMSVALVTACLKRGFVISVSDGEKARLVAAIWDGWIRLLPSNPYIRPCVASAARPSASSIRRKSRRTPAHRTATC